MRIPAEDVQRVGDEVGQRVDVVEAGSPVAVVDDHFHAAEIETCRLDDPLSGADQRRRRLDRCHACRLTAGLRETGIGRAQIEAVAAGLDLDCVEEPPAERFDTQDRAAAGRDIVLDEQDLVD